MKLYFRGLWYGYGFSSWSWLYLLIASWGRVSTFLIQVNESHFWIGLFLSYSVPEEGADGVDGELQLRAEPEEDAGDGLHHLLAVDLPREARLDHAALAPQRQRVVEAVVVDLREHSEVEFSQPV